MMLNSAKLTPAGMLTDFAADDREAAGLSESAMVPNAQLESCLSETEVTGSFPWLELNRAVHSRIVHLTRGQIHALDVRAMGNRIVVSGKTHSYYQKQLALQGGLETIRSWNGLRIELNVEVVDG